MTTDVESPPVRRRTKITKVSTPPKATVKAVNTPEPPRMPGRRNPKWIALGVIAICLGGMLSYVIYSRVAAETAVVAVAQTVYRGETIEAGDLTEITLSGGSVPHAVPAGELQNLVGKRAVFDLPVGAVVPSTAVADAVIPADGRAVVGLKLEAGRAPTSLLLPGSVVRLVALPAPVDAQSSDKLVGTIYVAAVVDQAPAADGTSTLVNVDVNAKQAPTIAMLASQDRLAVVRDADR
jgi:hypothetical protein